MDLFINAFLGFFVVVDPIGTTIIFSALSAGVSAKHRNLMALKSVLIAIAIVIFFGLMGAKLLEILGIQLNSFRIAGGVLLFHSAFAMITRPDEKSTKQRLLEEEDISVFPLAIPLLAGPGTLTLTILLASDSAQSPTDYGWLLAAALTVYVITFVLFLLSSQVEKIVGKTVNNVVKRLMGVLLAALAVQFIADGVGGLFF